jgi:hypothetical protein
MPELPPPHVGHDVFEQSGRCRGGPLAGVIITTHNYGSEAVELVTSGGRYLWKGHYWEWVGGTSYEPLNDCDEWADFRTCPDGSDDATELTIASSRKPSRDEDRRDATNRAKTCSRHGSASTQDASGTPTRCNNTHNDHDRDGLTSYGDR